LTLLAGRIADRVLTNRLTYFAAWFHPLIQQVDTVRAYHAGVNVIVELDIVIPPETPLKDAHDVGEALQHSLEEFEDVERAFVHIDYETSHRPEH
jgi:divalent metal cation (Fe/Co/Zn/Cd) transporter